MSKQLTWVRVLQDQAVKGDMCHGHVIICVSTKTFFFPKKGQCKIFPSRLLPPGTYVYVGIYATTQGKYEI